MLCKKKNKLKEQTPEVQITISINFFNSEGYKLLKQKPVTSMSLQAVFAAE